jgi:NAD(P)-dependent dehydrogenase (short-subunit alcohol dehydrogenase family)
MADRLKGKVALVFGAGCIDERAIGNGSAAAITFAREGASVACADINPEAADFVSSHIKERGGTASPIVADVCSQADVDRAVEKTLAEYGRIDILHNNVGIVAPGGPVEMPQEDWDRVIDTNLTGVFRTCKAVLPVMERQGGGSIVNISSIASIRWTGSPFISYFASKAGLNQFTRAIAVQYAPKNIRCNAVMPGLIDAPRIYHRLLSTFDDDRAKVRDARARSVPNKRMGTPWDVANAALFFASDEAAYVSGVVMAVDGALTCSVPHLMPEAG